MIFGDGPSLAQDEFETTLKILRVISWRKQIEWAVEDTSMDQNQCFKVTLAEQNLISPFYTAATISPVPWDPQNMWVDFNLLELFPYLHGTFWTAEHQLQVPDFCNLFILQAMQLVSNLLTSVSLVLRACSSYHDLVLVSRAVSISPWALIYCFRNRWILCSKNNKKKELWTDFAHSMRINSQAACTTFWKSIRFKFVNQTIQIVPTTAADCEHQQ